MNTPKLQSVRGTKDLMGEEALLHRMVIEQARTLAMRTGCQELATPIFEFTEVFKRTLGDTSDVVTKEMYSFTDKGGENLTLRPEFTAGIARCFIANGLAHQLPLKFFSAGPVFRYERPQKGRMRQFHQLNVEYLGGASPLVDVEIMALAAAILRSLGILSMTRLELNSLGDEESRLRYRTALIDYFKTYESDLSELSRTRLHANPLRILDSKEPEDKIIVQNAPYLTDYLTPLAQDFFATVQQGLKTLTIDFILNPRLVRGLDYYCHTCFEFITDHLGAQGTVLAGGRYDGLIGMMGGPATPAIGFAAGVERLTALTTLPLTTPRPLIVIPIGNACFIPALQAADTIRQAGFTVELFFDTNLSRQMKRAHKLQAQAVIFIGDDELAHSSAKVRDFDSGEEALVPLTNLVTVLAKYRT